MDPRHQPTDDVGTHLGPAGRPHPRERTGREGLTPAPKQSHVPPSRIVFIQGKWPSANSVLFLGDPPVLVDTGYHTELPHLAAQLSRHGVALSEIGLIVNTHAHIDHIGGNRAIHLASGAPIALHEYEGRPIAQGDWWATGLRYLDQEAPPFGVDRYLHDGDVLDIGGMEVEVLHVPGHSSGSIALHVPAEETLILGDLFHADDVGWINARLEGAIAVYNARRSLERIRRVPARVAYSGHGPPITDIPSSLQAALARIESFLADPRRMAVHGMKRILVFALMIRGGLPEGDVLDYLGRTLWFPEFCVQYFPEERPEAVADRLLSELREAGAITVRGGRLVSTAMLERDDR